MLEIMESKDEIINRNSLGLDRLNSEIILMNKNSLGLDRLNSEIILMKNRFEEIK